MTARIGATPLARVFNGAHLRKVRVFDRGYTLKELAGKCGCSEQAISQYERGKRSMDVYTCKRILNALQCTPHDVLCKDDQVTMIAEFSEHAFVYIGAEHTSGASVNTSRTTYVDDAPTIDAELMRHGRWKEPYPNDIWDCYECSCCGKKYDRTFNFCPECGAKMDLEAQDEQDV